VTSSSSPHGIHPPHDPARTSHPTWLDGIGDGCLVISPDLRVHYTNIKAAAHWRLTPDELRGRALTEFLPAEAVSLWHDLCRGVLERQASQTIDEAVGGRVSRLRAHPVPAGVLILLIDVTHRRQYEDELLQSVLLCRMVLEQIPTIQWTMDRDLRILLSTGAGLKDLGWKQNETVGLTLQEMLGTSDPEHLPIRMHRLALQGQPVHYEHDFKDRQYEVTVQPLRGLDEEITGVVGLAYDVTEKRRAERERAELQQQLFQSQKLESLGILAGGVAHDFNNLLVGILNAADLLLHELPVASSAHGLAKLIQRTGERARDVIHQMLVCAGKSQPRRCHLDLNQMVRDNLALLDAAFHRRGEVSLALAADLPQVLCDPGQMQQVVLNLLVNAAEALPPEGGRIQVSSGWLATGQRDGLPADMPAGEYVFLEVVDNGSGIPEEAQARIFDPFFTTKATGRGLGLTAVAGILRGHGGGVRLWSRPGQGTTFRIYLPLAHPEATAAPTTTPTEPAREGVILLIDDEPSVRDVAARALRAAGETVLPAASGAEGLELFRTHADAVRLVLLDLRMPEMSGWQVLQAIHDLRPDVRVLLTSGYPAADWQKHPAVSSVAGFLAKPYNLDTLVATVRQLTRPS
jgi:PAS domain S-box-containing protein